MKAKGSQIQLKNHTCGLDRLPKHGKCSVDASGKIKVQAWLGLDHGCRIMISTLVIAIRWLMVKLASPSLLSQVVDFCTTIKSSFRNKISPRPKVSTMVESIQLGAFLSFSF